MTALTARLQTTAMVELVERKRVARRIALASTSITAVIAIVASILAVVA
jgi:hypothetical protein